MLIKCPECGKEISDKSKQCIHCGFPLEERSENDALYKLVLVNYNSRSGLKTASLIQQVSNYTLSIVNKGIHNLPYEFLKGVKHDKALEIQESFKAIDADVQLVVDESGKQNETVNNMHINKPKDKDTIKCPKCGSIAISTGQRGFSLMTGFIGSNKTINRCANCGHKWYPR